MRLELESTMPEQSLWLHAYLRHGNNIHRRIEPEFVVIAPVLQNLDDVSLSSLMIAAF